MDQRQSPNKNFLLAVIPLTILLIGLSVFAVRSERKVAETNQQVQQLKHQNNLYTQELNELKGITASSTETFNSLYSTLSNEKKNLEEKVSTLDRLTKVDPQLLKKYSKVYFLNENYTPSETQTLPEAYVLHVKNEYKVHVDVVYFLEQMIDDAKKEGLNIVVVSAYRSFTTQAELKKRNKVTYGVNTANRFVAEQGYSEHQLGTTVDVSTPSLVGVSLSFERTPEFKWLQENAYKYGFILSYPKGNAYYAYEPWHWRFVGKALAAQLNTDKINFYNLDQRFIDEYLINMFDR